MTLVAVGAVGGWSVRSPSRVRADPPPPVGPGEPCPPPVAPIAPVGRASPASAPLTTFEFRIVSAADVIVVGAARLVSTATIKGTTVARVEVEKVLKGSASKSFTLFVGGPRSTDDPRVRSPSTPYVDRTARRSVLFLRATPNGSGLALETLIPLEGLEGEEKLEVLEKELAVFALEDPVARKRDTLALLVSFVAGEKSWTRTHGIRELESLSRRAPEAFDDASLDRLDVLRQGVRDRGERALLSATLDRLDPDRSRRERGAAVPAPTEPAAPSAAAAPPIVVTKTRAYVRAKKGFATATDDESRTGSLSDMARLAALASVPDLLLAFGDASPAVRERAAVLLADVGADSSWPTLRAAFETEPSAAVRDALVRSAGFLGADADVDWVLRASHGPELRRARCFALARIRSPQALAALAKEGEAARAATPEDAATAALVEYLAGPVFAKTDPAIGQRTARPAPK